LAKKEVRVGIFATGITVALILLILIIRSIFYTSMLTAVPQEYKSKLIEAEQILGRSSRDMANKELFKENLTKAEALVFEVREKKVFANDVKKLLEQISVMKRQMNGIESYSLETRPVDFTIPKDAEAVALFENAKKLYVVGKKGVYGPFIKGNETRGSSMYSRNQTEYSNSPKDHSLMRMLKGRHLGKQVAPFIPSMEISISSLRMELRYSDIDQA
jgi:hypothetical protein